jgi:hypothetical protein
MQDFDKILKQLLTDPSGRALQYITGHRIVSWRNVEMPATRNLPGWPSASSTTGLEGGGKGDVCD